LNSPLKILATGGDGLLAHALSRLSQPDYELIFVSRRDFDLTNSGQMERQVDHFAPQAVINTAAYNLVDRCEIERDLSWAANALGPGTLATICATRAIPLVHFGTDYVFDGAKKTPYRETDATNPLNHYAAGKLAGELAELPALLRKLKTERKRIIGYGASAKGNTLLNTCGITTKELDYIIDNTPFKQGKIAPGSFIPVRPPELLLKDQPDYALLLAWNFAPEIIKRETEYQQRGGRFIVPIPEPKIVPFPA